jgi:hypothetical protein
MQVLEEENRLLRQENTELKWKISKIENKNRDLKSTILKIRQKLAKNIKQNIILASLLPTPSECLCFTRR